MNTPFFLEEIVLLGLVGGILAVEDRVGWQGLFSQPLFGGIITGFLLSEVWAALEVGVVLELVWLSILPMRATRRPDGVTGAVVGAATACLLIKHTGDPRTTLVVSFGVFVGLAAGQLSGWLGRLAYKYREKKLGDFTFPEPANETKLAAKLGLYWLYSAGFYFVVQAVLIFVLVPAAALLGEAFTGLMNDSASLGARRWLEIMPAVGAASVIQLYWQKHLNRYLILFAAITLVLLWFK